MAGRGNTSKHRGFGYYIRLLGALLLLLMAIGYVGERLSTKPQTPAERAEKRKEAIEITFAADGATRLQKAMRNPDSFKLAQALIMRDGAVCYDYRAQNGFGGMNVGHAVLSPDGRLDASEMSGFRAAWNKECAHKTGIDKTWEVGYAAALHGLLSDK